MNETGNLAPTTSMAFEDIDLRVGAPMQMQQEGISGRQQFNIRYVGAIAGVSFLTTLPRHEDSTIWLRPGSLVTFRVLASTHVYAFTASTLRAHSRPSDYAHFSLPGAVHCREVRRHLRAEVRLPVQIRRPDGSQSMAILHDISVGGATLELVGLLASPGDTIGIEIPLILPELVRKLLLTAWVRNCSDYQASVDQGRFRYGVEFQEMGSEDSLHLHYFIDHAIAELHVRC